MHVKLFYVANPRAVRIALLDSPLAPSSDPGFERPVRACLGITDVSWGATGNGIRLERGVEVTWREVLGNVLRVLRDHFMPNSPIVVEDFFCGDRALLPGDVTNTAELNLHGDSLGQMLLPFPSS